MTGYQQREYAHPPMPATLSRECGSYLVVCLQGHAATKKQACCCLAWVRHWGRTGQSSPVHAGDSKVQRRSHCPRPRSHSYVTACCDLLLDCRQREVPPYRALLMEAGWPRGLLMARLLGRHLRAPFLLPLVCRGLPLLTTVQASHLRGAISTVHAKADTINTPRVNSNSGFN